MLNILITVCAVKPFGGIEMRKWDDEDEDENDFESDEESGDDDEV
jgi:hypothetical protein